MVNFYHLFIYNFDLFKSKVPLLFNSNQKIASKFSCFISVLILTFLVYFFFKSDLFLKEMPYSSNQSISVKNRPDIDFTQDNMGLSFAISDNDNRLMYIPELFTFAVSYEIYNVSIGSRIHYQPLKFEQCKKENFKAHGNYFNELGLVNATCITNGSNFTLGGYWDEQIIKFLEINVLPCDNQTSTVTCRPQEEIFQFFQGKYLNVYYATNIVDVNNYERPVQQIYQITYCSLDPSASKEMRLTFKKTLLSSDDGIVFPNTKIAETFVIGGKYIESSQKTDDYVVRCTLYSGDEIYSVVRRYQKFQEAIATVGGLANSLIAVGLIITFLEKEFIVFVMIMGRLYSFYDPNRHNLEKLETETKDHNVKDNKIEMTVISQKILNQDSPAKHQDDVISPKLLPQDPFILEHFSEKDFQSVKGNKMNEKQEQKLKNVFNTNKNTKNKEISINFIEFLKIRLHLPVKLTKKEQMFAVAWKEFPQKIDLIEIIQKIHEIDKLKVILLTPEQNKLFNLLAKPTVILNEDKQMQKNMYESNFNMMMNLESTKQQLDLNELRNYVNKVTAEGKNASEIDKRLLNLLDENIF